MDCTARLWRVETDVTPMEQLTRSVAMVLHTRNALHFALDHAPWYFIDNNREARSALLKVVRPWCTIVSNPQEDDNGDDSTVMNQLLPRLELSVSARLNRLFCASANAVLRLD